MNDALAIDILDRYEALKGEWRVREPEMRAIQHLINPTMQDISPDATPGDWRAFQGHVYNSLPIVYKDKLAAQLYSTMVNPASEWCALTIPDEDLRSYGPVADWLDRVSTLLLYSFSTGVSNFYSQAMPYMANTVSFGTGIQFDRLDEEKGRFRDMTLPMGRALIGWNADDEADEMMWRFDLTAAQAVKAYGRDGDRLPDKITERAEKKDDRSKFGFILAIYEADGWEPGRMGAKGKPWRATVIYEEGKMVVREDGHFENPVTAAPWLQEAGEGYGRGQAYAALGAARYANLTDEALIRASQFAAMPINLASHEKVLPRGRRIRPGMTLYGAMVGGRRNFDQMGPSSSIAITAEHQARKLEEFREAMHGTMFHLQGRTGLTRDEWFDQHANHLRMMAPMLTNLEARFLHPKISRRYGMMTRLGWVDPPPPDLAGQSLQLEMRSAASLALRAGDGQATVQLMTDLSPLLQLGDRNAQRLSARLDPDGLAEVLAQARGAPARVLRSREEADAIDAAEAEAAAAAAMAEAAPAMAGAARDLASIGEGAEAA